MLENYRRIQENKLFDRIVHEERQKKAFLKNEGRKIENVIENYEERFGQHGYMEDSEA